MREGRVPATWGLHACLYMHGSSHWVSAMQVKKQVSERVCVPFLYVRSHRSDLEAGFLDVGDVGPFVGRGWRRGGGMGQTRVDVGGRGLVACRSC